MIENEERNCTFVCDLVLNFKKKEASINYYLTFTFVLYKNIANMLISYLNLFLIMTKIIIK